MKYSMKWSSLLLSAVVLIGTLSACGQSGGAEGSDDVPIQTSVFPETAGTRTPTALDLTDATAITLSGSNAFVEGNGAASEGNVVTITAAGVYVVSGSLEDGRIIVDASEEDVTVVLNGAEITCSYGSPLYVYKAGTATVHLMEGTENTLTDGFTYTFDDAYSSAADEEPNACLYSKADLVIAGAGKLTVTANFDNGITSKDTLQIYNSSIFVTAVDNGINGKDSNTIDGASITVTCGGNAIRSTNDADGTLGWVTVSNSTLNLTTGEDGIQAETALTMSGGSCAITSGGGSGVRSSASAKGLKAGTVLNLIGGTYTLDCSDDAIHSNGNVTISGGSYTISTGDDAVHADEALSVSDGEINVLTSYEGLEGTSITVSGGTIRIISSDDGMNAAGGVDGSGFGGFRHGNDFGGGNSDSRIDISGGYLVVKAGGDGLDSNGNIVMSGGTVIVSSTGQADGALDYDGSFTLSGGTLLAVGNGNMSQTPSQSSQYIVSLGFDSLLSAGTYVSLAGENQSFVWELPVSGNSVVFSSPDLEGGAAYSVSYGGDYNGESVDGLCFGGTYSGGTDLTVLTLSDYITTYGSRGMGNMGGRPGGNMGGRPDGSMGDEPWGGRDEFPADEVPGNNGIPGDQRGHGGPNDMPGDQRGHGGPDDMPEDQRGHGEPDDMPEDQRGHGGPDDMPDDQRGHGEPSDMPIEKGAGQGEPPRDDFPDM